MDVNFLKKSLKKLKVHLNEMKLWTYKILHLKFYCNYRSFYLFMHPHHFSFFVKFKNFDKQTFLNLLSFFKKVN